jgi:hypothetical protein
MTCDEPIPAGLVCYVFHDHFPAGPSHGGKLRGAWMMMSFNSMSADEMNLMQCLREEGLDSYRINRVLNLPEATVDWADYLLSPSHQNVSSFYWDLLIQM